MGPRKLSANEQFFCWCSNSSKFVTNNSDYVRRLFYNWPWCLRQLKSKSFESRRNFFFLTRGGCVSRLRACLGGCFQSYQYPNLSEGADRVGGQLRGDKECPFSGVTKSPSLISRTVSVDVKHHVYLLRNQIWQSLEEGAGKQCSDCASPSLYIIICKSMLSPSLYIIIWSANPRALVPHLATWRWLPGEGCVTRSLSKTWRRALTHKTQPARRLLRNFTSLPTGRRHGASPALLSPVIQAAWHQPLSQASGTVHRIYMAGKSFNLKKRTIQPRHGSEPHVLL